MVNGQVSEASKVLIQVVQRLERQTATEDTRHSGSNVQSAMKIIGCALVSETISACFTGLL